MVYQRRRQNIGCLKLCVFLFSINVLTVICAKLDIINCGADDTETEEGPVGNEKYPWLGVLFYTIYGDMGETRSVTTVALIHREFVVGNSADVGPMPKDAFRDQARVLLGEGWERPGRRVRNYVVHPEYGQTINSIALIHLRQPVRESGIKPVCPPPERIRFPRYWALKYEEKLETLQKRVLPMESVPSGACRDFYISANLYEEKRRPSHVLCATSVESKTPCVWNAGAALSTRDVWNRWQLLGLGVYGAGCGVPSRYLDMRYYYPWIEEMLGKFQRITISRINNHRYVLRSGSRKGSLERFGECDPYEKKNLIYRDSIQLRTDNNNVKIARHNMTIYESVQYTCVTIQLEWASASTTMRVQHFCPRGVNGPACYAYRGTRFDIAVEVMFTEACLLDIHAWGLHVNMSLIDIQEWKWEEGTYYEDFRLTHVEYRGPEHMTQFGFEPLDERMWVPDYERWTTEPFKLDITTSRYTQNPKDDAPFYTYKHAPTTTLYTTTTTKWRKKFRKRTEPSFWEQVGGYLGKQAAYAIQAIFNFFESWG